MPYASSFQLRSFQGAIPGGSSCEQFPTSSLSVNRQGVLDLAHVLRIVGEDHGHAIRGAVNVHSVRKLDEDKSVCSIAERAACSKRKNIGLKIIGRGFCLKAKSRYY